MYSEICARLRPTRSGRPVPIGADDRATRFYVCPRTGLLRERRLRRRRRPLTEPVPDRRWDGPRTQLRRIEGIWYALGLAPVPDRLEPGLARRDHFLARPLAELRGRPELLLEAYGRRDVYCAMKRQLSKRELPRLEELPWGHRRVGS